MLITRVVRNDNGSLEATLMLTPDQAAYLINVGLLSLVEKGSLTIEDVAEETFTKQLAESKPIAAKDLN